ncbi:TetR/AcrR family transcriptional regulator [Streptomyces johnsoniae]|uniref:TetR/AcrR family transcriptional regulator n=1 Tax=Streptomyces johnsoniae TaxID=3075532 RepID=A0ABU2RYR5_9ACTN|nr:TetR/AcrR family transcriptional regulator [Streptomyces sp. DSM 41886]MDT0441902.1 TetR/AcrR family transcriptional regulator [Streptomyces sp. DSM 41886]
MTTTHSSGSGDISRSLQLMWQVQERPARGPKPGLTLTAIVGAAVALADREGLAALSMRRVAAELGVGTMTLYRYIPGKGELLDLMLDHIEGFDTEPAPPEAEDWRAGLARIAWGTYRHYLARPWLLQVNQSRPLLGPNALLGFDRFLAVLDGLGLTAQERIKIIMTIDAYVTGTARHYVLLHQAQEETHITDEEFWNAQAPIMETAYASGCYPHVFSLPASAFDVPEEEVVRFGIDRVLDGIAAFLATLPEDRREAEAGCDGPTST